MIGRTFGQYRILEQIGAGGMGVVYRARDERLDRDVAVKVLPSGLLADETARKRFRKEALALSKLNHPNIETVHDFNTQDGVDFLVMEYIPGVTLDQKLMAGSLSDTEVFRLGAQLAEGLAAAHSEGVVHRDLKPGNLRLTPDGRLKIMDFGLAKLHQPVNHGADTESLTQAQGVSGTVPYMAPEQLRNEPSEPRQDIWAAGAVLYELATRRRPFPQTAGPLLTDAILHHDPVAVRALNPDVSPEMERIVLKCLEKDPDNRYQTAKELAVDLRRLSASHASAISIPSVSATPASRRVLPLVLIAVAVVATVWVGWMVRQRQAPGETTATPAHVQSIAVLPLANLSGDPSQEYFADGMTEALISNLAKISALRVISRTSVMQYKGVKKSLPEIARELNVDTVLEGSVLRDGERIRITVQLIRAPTDENLWAETYDRDLRGILALQSEVARAIAGQIMVTLSPEEQARLAGPRAVNPRAHEAYLHGLFYLHRATEKDLNTAIESFQQSIERDPNYAPGYAGLAGAYATLSSNYRAPREVMPQAKVAALKALELDPNLAEAHAWLGFVSTNYDWDAATASRELQRAIELNPNYADARSLHAWLLSASGQHEQAIAEATRAQELDPYAQFTYGDLPWILQMARRFGPAIQASRTILKRQPDFGYAHSTLGMALAEEGQFAEAVREAQEGVRLDDSPWLLAILTQVHARAGNKADALKVLKGLKQLTQRRYVCYYELAVAYVELGDHDEAFRWLDRAVEARSDCMVLLEVDPRLDNVRADTRYQALVRRVGFGK